MKKILFLCTGNSCRSQMAHGFANSMHNSSWQCYSAGIVSHGMNKFAIQVMAEIGIDISEHTSQTLSEFGNINFDYVATVCDHAVQNCPTFSQGEQLIHQRFDDPPKLALHAKTDEESLDFYRQVRDEIQQWVAELPEQLRPQVTPTLTH